MIETLTKTEGEAKPPRRGWVVLAIALIAWGTALILVLVLEAPAHRANDFFYDVYYGFRPETDMRGPAGGDVVLVTADQQSLDAVSQRFEYGWPWPREFWGQIAVYLDKAGARAIVFDIVFQEKSVYQKLTGDDDNFAEAINGIKTPVIFGATAKEEANGIGVWEKFAPAVKGPVFGAVNVGDSKVYRWYWPTVDGLPSLAVATVEKLGVKAEDTEPFRLRYYGPHVRKNGELTFTYLPAAAVLGAQIDGEAGAKKYGISPEMFKGKIVILCATALGTYDLKSSPLSAEYPGPEVQATAIENLLRHDRVESVAPWQVAIVAFVLALLVTWQIVIPRQAASKLAGPIIGAMVLLGAGILIFCREQIVWLPPVLPLLAMVLATPLAFAWTYLAEDRQRRFMLKALSKVVSPAVANELSRNPERLARGTIRTDLTLLFTDLANFTDLSEGMDVQHLGTFMNRYLGAMSDQVFAQDGTLDKYIGDAVMAFWNAPLPQKDHAVRACRAALLMVAREDKLRGEFAASAKKGDTGHKLFTRIGINTAAVAVGFIGSEHLFNYTALGDGVNLASRLEGANKLYGTRILLSANTAELVNGDFWLRKVDVLRVKGKKEPMAVYELRGVREGDQSGAEESGLVAEYEGAFGDYQRGDWDGAEQRLLEVLKRFGEDGPATALLKRVQEFRDHPPESGWDGVYDSKSK